MSLHYKYGLFSIFFLLGFFSFGQESTFVIEENPNEVINSSFYREDQIYLGVSFVGLVSDQENFYAKGLSSHFQWGVVRDFPIVPSGKLAVGLGLGMGFDRHTTNLNRIEDTQGKGIYSLNTDVTASSLFFSMQSLELPISFRWRSSSPSDYAFWRVYGGVAFQWNYRMRAELENVSLPVKRELNQLASTAHLSFGYNTWNFYLAYRLTPFFKTESLSSQTLPINITPIKVGLIFYLL